MAYSVFCTCAGKLSVLDTDSLPLARMKVMNGIAKREGVRVIFYNGTKSKKAIGELSYESGLNRYVWKSKSGKWSVDALGRIHR